MVNVSRWIRALKRTRKGQGLVEYGLILGLIAVVAIGALSSTGGSVAGLLNTIAASIAAVNSDPGAACDAGSLCSAAYQGAPAELIQACTDDLSQPQYAADIAEICASRQQGAP
jgi:pilus assembly protein Flp/PilA